MKFVKEVVLAWTRDQRFRLKEQFWFGMRESLIYKHDLDPTLLFMGHMIHGGVNYKKGDFAIARSKNLIRYPILSWSELQSVRLRALLGNKVRIIEIGSPFLHLTTTEDGKRILAGKQDSGTLVYFPNHTHWGEQHIFTLDEEIREISNGFREKIVCLFWLDFLDSSLRDLYLSNGFKIVCLGYRGASGGDIPWEYQGGRATFLAQLIKLFSHANHFLFDSFSISYIYAASLGKRLYVRTQIARHGVSSASSPRIKIESDSSMGEFGMPLSRGTWLDAGVERSEIKEWAELYLGKKHIDSFSESIKSGEILVKRNQIPDECLMQLQRAMKTKMSPRKEFLSRSIKEN